MGSYIHTEIHIIDGWVVTDRWWLQSNQANMAFCGCGWSTPNMVTSRRAWTELKHHQEKEHGAA